MMIVFDSDFLIDLFDKAESIREKLQEIMNSNEDFAVTIFNVEEVLFGYSIIKEKNEKFRKAVEFFNNIQILFYDWKSMEKTIEVKKQLKAKGTPIGLYDELISGICLANNASFVTRNKAHFSKVDGLKVIDY